MRNNTSLKTIDLGDKFIIDLDSKENKTVNWKWTPEYEGDYKVIVTTWLEDDDNPNNNEKWITANIYYFIISEDFEDDIVDWDHGFLDTDESGLLTAFEKWEHGTPQDELINGGKGPGNTHSGSKCFGIDLDDKYGTFKSGTWEGYKGDSVYLEKKINLEKPKTINFTFFHWLEIEDSGDNLNLYDKAYVEVRIDKGETWEVLWKNPVAPNPKNETVYRTEGWEKLTLNLTKFLGNSSVTIRWRLMSDYTGSYAGWYIDDVLIMGYEPLTRDASIESIDSPLNNTHISPNQEIKINATIKNLGKLDLINTPVYLKIYENNKPNTPENMIYENSTIVGTIENPIKNNDKTQVSFTWLPLPIEIKSYVIVIKIVLNDDGNPENDIKKITVVIKKDWDISINTISIYPLIGDFYEPRTISVEFENLGNIPIFFNLTFSSSYSKEDKIILDHIKIWKIELKANEKLENWDYNWIPKHYGEFNVRLYVENILFYQENSEWHLDENFSNNEKNLSTDVIEILWFDDMEWSGEIPNGLNESETKKWIEENYGWNHESLEKQKPDGCKLEFWGYSSSNSSWRFDKVYYDYIGWYALMNNTLTSPLIQNLDNVKSRFGICFWIRFYSYMSVDGNGRYWDNLFIEYLIESGEWNAFYDPNYDKNPEHKYYDARLFVPKDDCIDSSNKSEYPNNKYGWILISINFEDYCEMDGYYYENGTVREEKQIGINDYNKNNVRFRFRMKTEHRMNWGHFLIDDVSVFGITELNKSPKAVFTATCESQQNKDTAYSWNAMIGKPELKPTDNILSKNNGVPLYEKITFDATESCDPEDDKLAYIWDFGDGTILTGKKIIYKYSKLGNFTVKLTVIDEHGISDRDTIIIKSGNQAVENVKINVISIEGTNYLYSLKKYKIDDKNWRIWINDNIELLGTCNDPEGLQDSELKYRWTIIENIEEIKWSEIKWKYDLKNLNLEFDKAGNYGILLVIDDGFNNLRNNPKYFSEKVVENFSWMDFINLQVINYAILENTTYINDSFGNEIRIYYKIAYEALEVSNNDSYGQILINQTQKPYIIYDGDIGIFLNNTLINMFDENGNNGFIWANFTIHYNPENIPFEFDEESIAVFKYLPENEILERCLNSGKIYEKHTVWVNVTENFILVPIYKEIGPKARFTASWIDSFGNEHEIATWVDGYIILNEVIHPYKIELNATVTFDATPSINPNGGDLKYDWKFYKNENLISTDKIFEYKFSNYTEYRIILTIIDEKNNTDSTGLSILCGDQPIYDVELKVDSIYETNISAYPVNDLSKYNSGENWTIWEGDKIIFNGAGAKDPEGRAHSELFFKWGYLKVIKNELSWENLKWITNSQGVYDFGMIFEKPGKYKIILEVDDGFNENRSFFGIKPKNCSSIEISKYFWIDEINITVLPFARLLRTVFIMDLDNNVAEVRYEIAYQAKTLITKDEKCIVNVSKTNEPVGSDSNRQIKTFVNFKIENINDEYGEEGFVWFHIVVIYPFYTNKAEPILRPEPKDIIRLYYWEETYNSWIKCENTRKATANDLRYMTAVEANITHFSLSNSTSLIIAPIIDNEIIDFRRDPSIEPNDITFSVDAILGRGDEERTVKIYAKIRNLGLLTIDELDIKFKDGDVVIGEKKVANIPGKGSTIVSIDWIIRKDIYIGLHTIKVELDPSNKLTDNSDTNDISRRKINVIEPGFGYYPRSSDYKEKTDISDLYLLILFFIILDLIIYRHNKKHNIRSSKLLTINVLVTFGLIIFVILCSIQNSINISSKDTLIVELEIMNSNEEEYNINITEINHRIGVIVYGIDWYISDNNGNIVNNNYGNIYEIYGLTKGNVTFHDNDRDGKVTLGDTFSVAKEFPDGTKIPEGYKLTLKCGGKEICSAVLTN